MATKEPNAIDVDRINLKFGRKSNVLNGLSLQLPRGSIYGLLGPSGCGKTSLIRCILGVLSINSGSINVFGKKPGKSGSTVPGSGVGYMPQDITLYYFLTIFETLQYYGSIFGLSSEQCSSRAHFLIKFLNLPNKDQQVGSLSGGQKRRVSLATALIHKPPLLVLDEPTVGVDPLLRKAIWEHLIDLSKNHQQTVLITTHYIEEAKDANLIGLMREGRILEQDNPKRLMQRYKMESLENVFLHLCNVEEKGINQVIINHQAKIEMSEFDKSNEKSDYDSLKQNSIVSYEPINVEHVSVFQQTGTLLKKHLRRLIRSPGYLMFQFLLPMAEAILFALCIGLNVHSIPVAIYDGDQTNLSKAIIQTLNRDIVVPHVFDTRDEAYQSVRNGIDSTMVIIMENFSLCFAKKVLSTDSLTESELYNSTIHLMPDMSNRLMIDFAYQEIIRSFLVASSQFATALNLSPDITEMPVKYDEPIYGHLNPPYTEFMTPGVMLGISFFAAISLTTMNLVVERREKLIERTVVAGVSHTVIIVSFLAINTFILVVQVVLLLITLFVIFKIFYFGSMLWIAILTFLQSFCGLMFGLMVSSIADNESTATMLSLGIFFPIIILSGAIWPLEAMNDLIRYFSYTLPVTIPARSLRFIMFRGWNPTDWEVTQGFIVTFVWIFGMLLISTLLLKYKQ
ncbi:hypothetical protein BLOT_013829 [Blomia tropicalis]|nr:hypothetical protein BLOT_013829 [Blomia tropicalis]